jgi:hypothetical protein
MINYKEIGISPSDRIEVAFRKVVRYVVPDVPADVVCKVADLVLHDNEYRRKVLCVIMNALEARDIKEARQ